MKQILFILFIAAVSFQANAQKVYATRNGIIKFFSSTPAEDIEATNKQVMTTLTPAGLLRFQVLIKGFIFPNSLMQQHFNDEYMESTKFPKAEYKGNIDNPTAINFTKDGSYPVTAKGVLTIHGISKPVTSTGTIVVTKGKVSLKSVFKIKVSDYGITGSEIGSSIAKELEITVNAAYD